MSMLFHEGVVCVVNRDPLLQCAVEVGDIEAEPFFHGLWGGYRQELSSDG
jgi:hypothetical protein